MVDADQEYAEAKAAYLAAQQRLIAARKAWTPPPSKDEVNRARRKQVEDAVWQAYFSGERDFSVLANISGHRKPWVRQFISDQLRYRRFGPHTAEQDAWMRQHGLGLESVMRYWD